MLEKEKIQQQIAELQKQLTQIEKDEAINKDFQKNMDLISKEYHAAQESIKADFEKAKEQLKQNFIKQQQLAKDQFLAKQQQLQKNITQQVSKNRVKTQIQQKTFAEFTKSQIFEKIQPLWANVNKNIEAVRNKLESQFKQEIQKTEELKKQTVHVKTDAEWAAERQAIIDQMRPEVQKLGLNESIQERVMADTLRAGMNNEGLGDRFQPQMLEELKMKMKRHYDEIHNSGLNPEQSAKLQMKLEKDYINRIIEREKQHDNPLKHEQNIKKKEQTHAHTL